MRLFRPIFIGLALFFLFFSFEQKVYADTLTSAKDTITTSRPSASSPLSADAASTLSQVSIFSNGSRYLASDSAKIIRTSDGTIIANNLTIASQSAAFTTAYLTSTLGANTSAGAHVLIAPITAMHTISFTTVNAIPASGKIVITFPGSADNTASPSASDFAFNNLNFSGTWTSANVKTNGITCNNSSTITSPTITCITTSLVAAGTAITFLVGCSSATGATCNTQVPALINPTKTAAAGTADKWKISITTQDSSSIALDSATVSIGTIDSVQVQATVDPTLTFTIGGITNGTQNVNNGNTTGCTDAESTNAGISSTATAVNLGILSNTPTSTGTKVGNIAAQLLSISTNGAGGYVLTATSSGPLRNPATGFDIISSTTPAVFPNGTPWFGIHPCGLDVTAATWNSTANQNCNTYITGSTDPICKYAWPTQTSALTLASRSTGPVGNSLVAGAGLVSVAYAAGVDAGVPAGTYESAITYVATATF